MQEAMPSKNAEDWRLVMQEVMDGLWYKGSSEKGTPLPEVKPVRSRFVSKIKRADDGTIQRYRARPEAKELTQRLGIVFIKSFSPVVSFDALTTVIASAAV